MVQRKQEVMIAGEGRESQNCVLRHPRQSSGMPTDYLIMDYLIHVALNIGGLP